MTEAYLYYKLTYEPKGSGELIKAIKDYLTLTIFLFSLSDSITNLLLA